MQRAHVIAVVAILFAVPASARTWYVNVDGTGNAPTIEAAMDSASYADTVLVAPGEYAIHSFQMADGVTLLAAEGPANTRLLRSSIDPAGISCGELNFAIIDGFWFHDVANQGSTSAIGVVASNTVIIRNCVFTANDVGIFASYEITWVEIWNNTFIDNRLAISTSTDGRCLYNIIWDDAIGISALFGLACNNMLNIDDAGSTYKNVNFSQDPMFCNGPDDVHLQTESPCAPGNSPLVGCGETLIGALPVGCSATPTEEHSWGHIKHIYR